MRAWRWLSVALVTSACSVGQVGLPDSNLVALTPPSRACPSQAEAGVDPSGSIVVGYPDEPAAWLPTFFGDVASADLAAVWGLPLYDLDEGGQLRPRLVREAVELGAGGGGWQVRLLLCPGQWSDGEPVVAEDVVATIEALRATPGAQLVAPILSTSVEGPDVVVTFASAMGRWQHVLADVGTILPAHVLATDGIDAYRDAVPVSGGSYRLESEEPGRSRRFVAWPNSVLGAPVSQSLEVLVVPRYELALGLLSDGTLDVALGHLALESVPRAEDLEGLAAKAPFGGTLLTWQWQADTVFTSIEDRRLVQGTFALEPFAEALLDRQGKVVHSFVPSLAGPPPPGRARVDGLGELVIAAPRWHEAPGLLARALRDGFERMGGTMRTASEEADSLARAPLGDAHVVIRRLGPWPSLVRLGGLLGEQVAELAEADHAGHAGAPAVVAGLEALDALAVEVPLVQVAVAHVWRQDVVGIQPSSWPGIGFTSVARWGRAA